MVEYVLQIHTSQGRVVAYSRLLTWYTVIGVVLNTSEVPWNLIRVTENNTKQLHGKVGKAFV